MTDAAVRAAPALWRDGAQVAAGERLLPAEFAVAMVHDATTTAVLMATPADLADLGVGFSMTEGIVSDPAQIRSVEVVDSGTGIEVRLWLSQDRSEALAARRRTMAGPTGCGLCGVDSLSQAIRPPPLVNADLTLSAAQVQQALAALGAAQALNRETHAVHAAGFWTPIAGLMAAREDVGRHNALDKLVGALASRASAPPGAVVLTSRVSVEMVQKSAVLGAPILIAVSAPTALAVQTAQAAGITLVAIARADGFEVFTHPGRITS